MSSAEEERKRILDIFDYTIKNIDIEIDGRSRFDIYDINREAKKMLRYVRDQVDGTFDENWVTRDGETK